MNSTTFVLLSGLLTFGAPMLLAARELVMLRRDRGGHGRSWARRRSGTPDSPKLQGGTKGHDRPLPACLIEAARGAPIASREVQRALERA